MDLAKINEKQISQPNEGNANLNLQVLENLFKRKNISEKCIKSENILPQYEGLSEELICSICLDIVWHATCCKTCTTPFGKLCLEDWFLKSKTCPKQCEKFESTEVNHLLKRLINKLEFYCLYKENGCTKVVSYDNFYKHVNSCTFCFYECASEGCNYSGKKEDILVHVKECGYSQDECEVCKIKLLRKDYILHKSDLNNCLRNCLQKLKRAEDEIIYQNDNIYTLQEEAKLHKQTLEVLENENLHLKKEIDTLETIRDKVTNQNIKITEENDELKLKLQATQEKCSKFAMNIKALETSHSQAIQKIDELNTELFRLKNPKSSSSSISKLANVLSRVSFPHEPEDFNVQSNETPLTPTCFMEIKSSKNCDHQLELNKSELQINCDICGKRDIEVSWRCPKCDFDSCINCFDQEMPNETIKCSKKHLLRPLMYVSFTQDESCIACGNIVDGNIFACETCKYNLCWKCYRDELNKKCIIF